MAHMMTSSNWFTAFAGPQTIRSPTSTSRQLHRRHLNQCYQQNQRHHDEEEDDGDAKFVTLSLTGLLCTSSQHPSFTKRTHYSHHKHHHNHHHHSHQSKKSLLIALVLYLITSAVLGEEHVCKSIKIRNNVTYFHDLENCTVIEGSLEIVLIDGATMADYQNLTFPNLREVTDFVLFYRATGLTSIGRIFPNLSVIRGRELFHDFALTIYDMKQLIEIGLNNLTVIERGSVRIEKNPNLCFADTINWEAITKEKSEIKIKNNKNQFECPSCPEVTCPIGNPTSGRPASPLCWNPENCQRVCDPKCKNGCSVGNSSQCCHQECLGGCSGTNSTDCIACKRISHRGNCYSFCKNDGENLYEFLGRRCVTWGECIRMNPMKNYKVHQDKYCIPECPAVEGYEDDKTSNHTCVQCPYKKCPKVCQKGKIESVAQAQVYKGCTKINGSLEISVRGDANIVAELQSSLEHIETITGYLKITRSYPLITLHFFKNLKMIQGTILDRSSYSLVVMDNANLQELFPWNNATGKRLIIENGKVFFHMNPLLCLKEVDKLLKKNGVAEVKFLDDSNLTKFDVYDVSPLSNGDKTACDLDDLQLKIRGYSHNIVILEWIDYKATLFDPRELLGYLIYYKKATGNVSMYEGRDACTDTEWNVIDYEANEETKKSNETNEIEKITTIIPELESATRYAVYVKTYTIASVTKGGLSDIVYFTTAPHRPQQPSDVTLTAQSLGDDFTITIKWKPPKKPNGIITKYIIEGIQDLTNIEAYRNVDHCSEKPMLQKVLQASSVSSTNKARSANNSSGESFIRQILPNKNQTVDGINCCTCTKKMSVNAADEKDDLIAFEDALQNRVYVKQQFHVDNEITSQPESNNSETSRKRRSIPTQNEHQELTPTFPDETSFNVTESNSTIKNNSDTREPHRFYREVNAIDGENILTVDKLRHYAQYSIKVIACQKRTVDENLTSYLDKKCSPPNENSINTKPKKGADDIKLVNISTATNGSQHAIIVSWDEPSDPNGMIVTYHVEYFREPTGSKSTRCIKRSEYLSQANSFVLPYDLQPGKYSLRVKARSLVSDGSWTSPRYFEVHDPGSLGVWTIVSIALAAGFFVMIFAASSTWFVFKKFQNDPPPNLHYVSMNPEYMPAYEPDEWEIPREKTKLGPELGQGSFGMVYQGELYEFDGKDIMACAIKTVNDKASAQDKIEFLQEASTMKSFNNHHVVKLLGIVSTGHPVFVCMELMAKGDLKNYLRDCRDDAIPNGDKKLSNSGSPKYPKPTIKQVHLMATQIADGMSYLAAKKFVHRDLAGRNCMVADDLTVKIGDFGMTRDIYDTDYYRKGGKGLLPVRWMAPESLKDGVFTSQSDVWSFGVVLWEMVTLAQQPYQGLSNEQVLKFVLRGNTQDKPEKCPEHLFTIMKLCWNWNPKGRPTFTEIIEMLYPEIEKSAAEMFQKVSHYHNHVPTPVESMNDNETCPLTVDTLDGHESGGSGDTTVKFFPSIVGAKSEDEKVQIENDDNSNPTPTGNGISTTSQTNGGVKSSENNKSSEGSRESKVSNGSIANGHLHHQGAAKC